MDQLNVIAAYLDINQTHQQVFVELLAIQRLTMIPHQNNAKIVMLEHG